METQEAKSAVMMIEIGMTRQPRAYQSVRVGVTLPVFVTPEDDVQRLLEDRLAEAKFALEEEVDREFESYGEPAPYSKEPRYMLALLSQMKLGAILPVMETEKLPGGWRHARSEAKGHRWGYVKETAAKEWGEYRVVDASDGDLGLLPIVERYVLWTNTELGMAVLVGDGIKFEGRETYQAYFNSTYYFASPLEIVDKMIEEAKSRNLTLFECIEGNFSNLPAPPEPEPEPENDDDYNDEFEDDDDGHGDDED